jgi:membrane-associated progesterone receptor component
METSTLILLVVFVVPIYLIVSAIRAIYWPPKPVKLSDLTPMVGDITLEELSKHTGEDPFRPILFAVRGKIYNVTSAHNFYGPGGGYHVFAGREIARALAKSSLKEQDCCGDIHDLTQQEMSTLEQWENKFDEKYKIVGRLVPTKQLTLGELSAFDGEDPTKPILLSVRGVLFDVTKGRDFYGPDGAYPFGGKECARALAKFSTELSGKRT